MAALSFAGCAGVRYQGGPTADIGRIGRQQKFLQEPAREPTSPGKLPGRLAQHRNQYEPLGARPIRGSDAGGVEAEIYPGAPQYIDGISYWVPDRETIE